MECCTWSLPIPSLPPPISLDRCSPTGNLALKKRAPKLFKAATSHVHFAVHWQRDFLFPSKEIDYFLNTLVSHLHFMHYRATFLKYGTNYLGFGKIQILVQYIWWEIKIPTNNMLLGNTEVTNQYMTLWMTMLHPIYKNLFYQIQDSSASRPIKVSLTCIHWTNILYFPSHIFPCFFLVLIRAPIISSLVNSFLPEQRPVLLLDFTEPCSLKIRVENKENQREKEEKTNCDLWRFMKCCSTFALKEINDFFLNVWMMASPVRTPLNFWVVCV